MTLKYFNVKNGLTTGNIILNAGNSNISASTFIGNINVTNLANLGSIANVKITGGAANYVISTDGTGNLTWVAQSGGGGGSGAYNPVLDTFAGTGSQTAFTLSVTPATIYNTIVNIDGVSQLHDAYSLVGATITFDSAPSNGAAIEVLILATTDAGGTPGGSNTQVQFNNDGNFGGSSGLTFDSTTTTLTSNNIVVSSSANLGSVSNVIITGGTTGQYLQTDGAGNLSWSTVVSGSTSNISNGNSNVNIATANGNVNISSTGNANVVVVTGTGINVAGTINATGVITGNGSGISSIAGANITGTVANATHSSTANTVTDAAQSNITSVGTLTSLTSNGTVDFTGASNVSLGPVGNVKITGGTANYVLRTDGAGSLSWVPQSGGGSGSSISNGTSNVNIATSDGNVTTSVGGTSNVLVVTSTGVNVAGTLNATGNTNVGNIGATNGVFTNVSGNGSTLSSITGANVTGAVAFATTANSVAGANVSGQVGNALVAGTVYTAAQPNITSVGTLTGFTSNGTVNFTNASNVSLGPVGNVKITGGTADYVLSTDGTGNLSWVAQSGGSSNSISNGTSNVTIPTANGNINLSASGNANVVVVTGTGINVAGSITTSGSGGNISGVDYVIANFFSGSGNNLSNLQAANISGTVANANYSLYAGTLLTNAQPNITSVGTLTDLNVSGNAVFGGNLTVNGDLVYVNVTNLAVEDPIIQLQTGANGAAPTSNSGKDIGTALNYYDTAARVGFMGWDVSNAEIALASNVTITNEVATFNQYANVRASFFIGNGSQLTGITSAAFANYISNGTSNVNILTANSNVTVSVNGNANIVTVTGTGVNVAGTLNTTGVITGNGSGLSAIAGANVTGQVANATVAGTVYTAAQPNITSVGLLSALSVGPNSSITLTGSSGFVKANSIQGTDGVNAIYPAYSGATGAVGITGNLTVGIGVAANITANGNVIASYFIGNGSSLTDIAGGNVTGQVANALVAGTVYTNAQPNITSVGTLSNLTSNGTVNFTNSSNVSLGAVGNVKITGGTANYVLSTDGTGNLSWVAQSGGGGGGAANITIESQGTELTNAVAVIDFVGTGVTATNVGNVVTITVPGIEAGTGTYLTRTYTGDGNAVSYTVTDGVTVSSVIVALNGVLQTPTTDYTVSSNVLTFSAAPAANEAIQIREFGTAIGGSNTQVQFNDNGGFGGNANLTFDKTTGTLNATNITANGTPLATTGKAIAMAIVFGF